MKKSSNSYYDDYEVLDDDQRPINAHKLNCQNKDDCGNDHSAGTTCAGAVCHHRRGCYGEGGGRPPGDLDCSKQNHGCFLKGVAIVIIMLPSNDMDDGKNQHQCKTGYSAFTRQNCPGQTACQEAGFRL